jgi:hypothetical protein
VEDGVASNSARPKVAFSMLTDSERFAFTPRRIHGFASTGNAYDATQTDDRIASGDTLLIYRKASSAWPIAGPLPSAR